MKKLLMASLALAGFLCVDHAHAERVTNLKTASLAKMCSDPRGVHMCHAYLSGISDGVSIGHRNAINRGDKTAPEAFCLDRHISTDEMRTHFLSWASAHRDKLGEPAGEGVFLALHDTFPCHS